MRSLINIGYLLMVILHITAVKQQEENCAKENTAFDIGEKLTYKVAYNWNFIWINAGEVTFEVKSAEYEEQSCYHVVALGNTYSTYDWFYKVRDRYETYIDKKTLLPLRFIRDVYEGGYTIKEEVTFKNDENLAFEIKNGKGPKKYSIPSCTQDILSAVYHARNIDFEKYKKNDIIPITIFLDHTIYPLYIKYIGKATVKTQLGKFKCIKFKTHLIEGTIFDEEDEMIVWVTDDANKIPIRVETPIIVGSIKVDLISYKGVELPVSTK